ncbi:hypothetical protein BHE74_00051956, partial [Ensete ventricosum]
LPGPRYLILFPATISSPHQLLVAQPLPLSPPISPLSLSSAAALVRLYCPVTANGRSRCCLPHASCRHPCCRPSLPATRSSAAPHGAAFLQCLPAIIVGQPLAVHSQRLLDPYRCLLCSSVVAHNNIIATASQLRSPANAALAGPCCLFYRNPRWTPLPVLPQPSSDPAAPFFSS